MRKLATIQRIDEINPIENSDNLEVATVKGWKVVTQKGEYQAGDLCVYCEIDSFLPIRPEFEFLRKTSYKKMGDQEGFRLKTIKLRGQVSQGLLLPIEVLDGIYSDDMNGLTDNSIGTDVSDELRIVKYEPPIPAQLQGVMKGNFPSFIPKTDEERVQNLNYEELKQHMYIVTEKLDGSSFTCYLKDGQFGVCSRNMELQRDENNTFWKTAIALDIEAKMRKLQTTFPIDFALQGELIGEGVQGNKYGIKGHDIRFFTMHNISEGHRVNSTCLLETLYAMGLQSVPVLAHVYSLPETRDELIEFAEGRSTLKDTHREGLVFRATHDSGISFKVISNVFLLKDKS